MLPFTYPPLAAVAAVPVAWLPVGAAGLAVTALNVVLLYGVLRLFLRRLTRPVASAGLGASWLAAAVVPAAVVLDPVRVALVDGQIDIPLMALVAFDTLGPGLRIGGVRARGSLIGFAAAIKLTPAAYFLYYLARRQYRDAAMAAAAFLAFTLLGFLAAPPRLDLLLDPRRLPDRPDRRGRLRVQPIGPRRARAHRHDRADARRGVVRARRGGRARGPVCGQAAQRPGRRDDGVAAHGHRGTADLADLVDPPLGVGGARPPAARLRFQG
ncbi:MAG TPA: glycosyltransferase family 87 protein [Actinocrinis sp.]|nr:glycosyltransferase family 87 protein [Actinocrinis sp.]HEV3170554.1 glycosyltransferase family 87 protein [Actinocrinis sp.]